MQERASSSGSVERIATEGVAAGDRNPGLGARLAGLPLRVLRGMGLGRWLGLALLLALLVLRVWDPIPLQTLRLKTFDFYQVLQPRELSNQPIAIIDIDEASLDFVGQWPWPRTIVGDLVRQATRLGAVAIAFDVVFAEPDRASPAEVANALRGVDESFRTELRSLPSNDIWLANAMRESRVVLGQAGYPRPVGDNLRPIEPPPLAILGPDPRPFLYRFDGIVRNLPMFEQAAAGRGMFSLNPERDGVVRRVPAVMMVKDVIVPTLSLELLRVATGGNALAIRTNEAGIKSIVVGGVDIPTDRHGRLWVHYSQHDRSKYIPAMDVLRGSTAPDALRNKLVFVGTSATGLLDIKTTPVEPALPGVEVHAQLVEAILAGSILVQPNYVLGAELVMTLLIGLTMIVFVPLLGALTTLLLGGTVAVVLAFTSWFLYVDAQILLDVGFALIASLLVYGVLVYINYFREEAQRRQVRSAFGQYLSPALVEQLAEHPDRLVLGGETKVMSFLFCDVRGFTTISERYRDDPGGLTSLINRLLTPLTDAILGQGGTVDKYMGDCVMAFWNAPLDDSEHARHACAAALEMLQRLDRLNGERRQEAEAAGEAALDLRVGVGVNSGACVVGNVGSQQRFDYSVLGDAVNLASRLEGQSRVYGVPIIIGSETARRAGEGFAVLELDLIAVKGKTEPERIFALLGAAALARDPAFTALVARNGELFAAYRAQDWAAARQALEDCRALGEAHGLDAFYDLMATRIAGFMANPPGPDWNGVTVAETK